MGLFKLVCLPMKMMMRPWKKAFHLLTVAFLFTQIVVTLFMAVTFVMFTVLPALFVGFVWMMKRMRKGRMGKHGKMHTHMFAPRRLRP